MTLFEVLVVIAVLLVLAAILLPALGKARARNSAISCVNNLKQVRLAFRIWSGDNGDKFPMSVSVTNGGTMELIARGTVFPHFQIMSNELSTPKLLLCPSDKRQLRATNFNDFNDSNLSYFVGVDASETNSTMLLAGDRNLTLNKTALKPGLISLNAGDDVGWTTEMHQLAGNVLMADASVQQVSQSGLQFALKSTGTATNRLVIP